MLQVGGRAKLSRGLLSQPDSRMMLGRPSFMLKNGMSMPRRRFMVSFCQKSMEGWLPSVAWAVSGGFRRSADFDLWISLAHGNAALLNLHSNHTLPPHRLTKSPHYNSTEPLK